MAPIKKEESQSEVDTRSPLRRSFEHTIAIQASAAICTFVFYPLDSVKYRIMSQDGSHNYNYHKTGKDFPGLWRALIDTYKFEGITALYRGVVLAIVASVMSWGLYMLIYKYLLFLYDKHSIQDSLVLDYGASLIASIFCAAFTNPIWLIKTRMQLQDRTDAGGEYYNSFFHALREIIRKEGYGAMLRGMVPQMLLSIPNAFYIPLYELLKRTIVKVISPGSDRQCNFAEIFICSSIAKTFITIISNPLLVIKTKMQDHRNARLIDGKTEVKYTGLRSAVFTAVHREGLMRGLLLRGLGIGLTQKILRSTTHLVVYELFVRMFRL